MTLAQKKSKKLTWTQLFTISTLTLLYCGQCALLELAWYLGVITLQLAPETSYATLTLLGLAGYPFSLKALWSPAVDAWYVPRIGRRMTWILPLQFFLAVFFWCMCDTIPSMLQRGDTIIVLYVTSAMAMCATQDIAIDALAVEALPHDLSSYAGITNSVGYFVGYIVWSVYFQLATHSSALSKFLLGIAAFELIVFCIVFVYWLTVHNESEYKSPGYSLSSPVRKDGSVVAYEHHGIVSVWRDLILMLGRPSVRQLAVILLFYPVPFIMSYTMFDQLMKLGMGADVMTRIQLFVYPLDMVVSSAASKWITADRPLHLWYRVYMFSVVICALTPLAVFFHDPPHSVVYWIFLTLVTVILDHGTTFCVVNLYSAFVLYCKNELDTTSSTGSQMTVLLSISNFGRGLWRSVGTYTMHLITVFGPADTVPFYGLGVLIIPIGFVVATTLIKSQVKQIRFKERPEECVKDD